MPEYAGVSKTGIVISRTKDEETQNVETSPKVVESTTKLVEKEVRKVDQPMHHSMGMKIANKDGNRILIHRTVSNRKRKGGRRGRSS
jgi:hypothetical protein